MPDRYIANTSINTSADWSPGSPEGPGVEIGHLRQSEVTDVSGSGPLPVSFIAGPVGEWRIDRIHTIAGEGLSLADRLQVIEGPEIEMPPHSIWRLRGTTSNTRYSERAEVEAMKARQEGLRRPEATRAALIPIRKDETWWTLAQDQRRAIFEEQSRHIGIGMEYLPGIARRLHHSRDLGEPFDFLTWFEFAPEHGEAFENW